MTISALNSLVPKPVLKWAGGKGQLLEQMIYYLPQELFRGEIDRYIEPFIGGGAVFFWIAQHVKIKEFYLYDLNPELIILYQTLQNSALSLINALQTIEENYYQLNFQTRKTYFLQSRDNYNQAKATIDYHNFNDSWIIRSAQMIFLNRTCFNGLFRVNKQGHFNVPFGDYSHPKICNTDNILAISKVLKKVQVKWADFSECQNLADTKTFIYLDPPYRPVSKTANFKSYSATDFNDQEQKRLALVCQQLDQQGAKFMLSNSDPHNNDLTDNFFDDLYANFQIHRIQASRRINSNASKRGLVSELLITNYLKY